MTNSLSTTDRSAAIRQALKNLGISSRQVSVKTDYYSMGSSIRIKIKDASVSSALVEKIANEHESIDRDQSGEILSGGNRFVFVDYTPEAEAALSAQYLDRVKAALAQIHDNYLIPVEGTNYMIGTGRHGNEIAVWESNKGHICEASTVEFAAFVVGKRVLNDIAEASFGALATELA